MNCFIADLSTLNARSNSSQDFEWSLAWILPSWSRLHGSLSLISQDYEIRWKLISTLNWQHWTPKRRAKNINLSATNMQIYSNDLTASLFSWWSVIKLSVSMVFISILRHFSKALELRLREMPQTSHEQKSLLKR